MRTGGTILALATMGTLLVGATDSRGEGKLNADQEAARAAFQSDLKAPLQRLKEQCGVDITVKTDFENFKKDAWLDTKFAEEWEAKSFAPEGVVRVRAAVAEKKKAATIESLQVATGCYAVVTALADRCEKKNKPRDDDRKGRRGDPPTPPAASVASDVKGVSCLFAGAQPLRINERAGDEHTQRNMSFENGIFTVRNDPRLYQPEQNAWVIADAPAGGPIPTHHRNIGSQCTERSQCRSYACVKGVCEACGPKVGCAASAHCDNGICYSNERPPEESSSSSGPSGGSSSKSTKASKAPLGGTCKWDADCESKICGTLSSRALHKCVSKR